MLVDIKNLHKEFILGKNKTLTAVDGINLEIEHGRTYGLVGESGCGKSTTAKLLIRLLEPTRGTIRFNDANIEKLSARRLKPIRRDIQMVFQDPYASLHPKMTVLENLLEPVKIFKVGTPKEQVVKAKEMLETVGLDEKYADRYPHEFSGGQRQRICIARSLMMNPKLLILDEAVSALDVSIQSQILNLLKELQKEFNLTYLFISHDLSVVDYLCDEVSVMYLGTVVEQGTTEQVFSNPSHPYTKSLLSAIPSPDPLQPKERIILKGDVPSPVNPPVGCRFHTRCPYAKEICKIEQPFVEVEKNHFSRCIRVNDLQREGVL